jgi:hypothetical protein
MRPFVFAITVASVLAAACASSDSTISNGGSSTSSSGGGSSGDPNAAARALCVSAINAHRADVGLGALAEWSGAATCADGQAKSDAQSSAPHGAFGACDEAAQNECPGWPGTLNDVITSCLQAMWGEGPGGGHYDNITSTSHTKVTCGIYQTSAGKWWVVQDYR